LWKSIPRNLGDVKRTIVNGGIAYIGFNVPQNIMTDPPQKIWTVAPGNSPIVGGHAVALPGYDARGRHRHFVGSALQNDVAVFQQVR
jgi:hypothetical protein